MAERKEADNALFLRWPSLAVSSACNVKLPLILKSFVDPLRAPVALLAPYACCAMCPLWCSVVRASPLPLRAALPRCNENPARRANFFVLWRNERGPPAPVSFVERKEKGRKSAQSFFPPTKKTKKRRKIAALVCRSGVSLWQTSAAFVRMGVLDQG